MPAPLALASAAPSSGTRLRTAAALGLLTLVAGALLLFDLDGASLWGDEALYAVVTIDTLESGHLVPLRLLNELYLEKPIGGFLGLVAGFALFGVDEIGARAASVVYGLGAILVLGWAAARWFGPGYGLFAGLLLASSGRALGFHALRSGTFDAPLLLLVVSGLVLWIDSMRRESSIRFAAANGVVALSVLFKNLAGIGLVAPTIFLGELLGGREPLARRSMRALRRTALVLASSALLFGGWLFVLYSNRVPGVLRHLLARDVIERAQGDLHAGKRRVATFYTGFIQDDYGVLLLLLIPFGIALVNSFRREPSAERATLSCCASWAATMVLAVTLFQTKLAWYVLPAYPGIALCLTAGLCELGRALRPDRRWLVLALGGSLAAVQLMRAHELLTADPIRTPLHDLASALAQEPGSRLYLQPGLRFRARSERNRLRPQQEYYLRQLAPLAIESWPPAGAVRCPVLFLTRKALPSVVGGPAWTRYSFPSDLEKDGSGYQLLDGCGGRVVRRLGGTADQIESVKPSPPAAAPLPARPR